MKNKYWLEIADNIWTPYLKIALDKLFPATIPVLVTADVIMETLCFKDCFTKKDNEKFYKECIQPAQNKLERK